MKRLSQHDIEEAIYEAFGDPEDLKRLLEREGRNRQLDLQEIDDKKVA